MRHRSTTPPAEDARKLHQEVQQLLARARVLASDLNSAWIGAHEFHTRTGDGAPSEYKYVVASKLGCPPDRAYERAREVARERSRALECAYERACIPVRELSLDLARVLHFATALDLDTNSALNSAARLARNLDHATQLRQGGLGGVIKELTVAEQNLATVMKRQAERRPAGRAQDREGRAAQPGWVAVRVSGWAGRLLPAIARDRYVEELLDELYALAEVRVTRRRQLVCALRQLFRTPALRRAVRKQHSVQRAVPGGD
jgi:hypothetical protein